MTTPHLPPLSEKKVSLIVTILLCVMPIVGMAVDLIAPSLPAIAHSLQASVTTTQNMVAIYMLGYALGNFLTGFLTDAWGRRRLLLIQLFCFVIISILPIAFPTIAMLLITRLLQGFTIGAAAVIVRATFVDVLPAEKLVRLGTLIGALWGLGPVIGPVLGSYLQAYWGWQAGFYFLAIVTAILLVAIACIVPETIRQQHPLNIPTIRKNLSELLQHRQFMSIVVLMGLVYSVIILFNTVGPFLIQSVLKFSPVFYGHLALCFGLLFLLGTFLCRYCLKHYAANQIANWVLNSSLVFIILLLIAAFYFQYSIILLSIASGLAFFVTGMTFPMSMGRGMALFRHIAGSATAIMYLINILITSLISFLVSHISVQSILPLLIIYTLLIMACVFINRSIGNPTATPIAKQV